MTADYAIVLAGHGSRDPDGVREFEQLVALMRERVGKHRLDYGYLEFARPTLAEAVQASIAAGSQRIVVVPALLFAARPLVADGLRAATHLGQQRLIVLPFLLFDGILVKRVYEAAAALAARHPEIEVLTTHYMGVHQDIADLFLERAHEGVEGRAHMNCSLCKYRVQIVGFERQVGEPQRPHHRPVTGVPLQGPGYSSYVAPPLETEN